MLVIAACGDGADAEQPIAPVDMTTDTAPASRADAGVTPAPAETGLDASDSAKDAGSASPAQDAAPPTPADVGSKADAARPPLVLEVPKSSIMCGSTECDTLPNVCCESWSSGKGFGTSRTCITRDKCYDMYERAGEQNRAVPHECDGKEDCSGGQVCCMVADGQPLCSLDDALSGTCTSKVYGPGGSGICADNALCMLGSIQFIAAGVPLGVLACNDDSDCADRKGTTCQPEQDGSITTGTGIKARSYVKVCR
jgi:hypothetical protein